jgi:hypothetical protein
MSSRCSRAVFQNNLIVELSFEQKFKLDSRVEQIHQLNPRVEQPEPEEIELVTYKFLGFEQKLLFKAVIFSSTHISVSLLSFLSLIFTQLTNRTSSRYLEAVIRRLEI